MNPFAFAGILTGITSLGLGFFVFSRDPTRKLNQLWLAFSGSVALWGFGSTWIALEPDKIQALWAWRLSFACSVLWIPILFFHFVCTFCNLHYPRQIFAAYGSGVVLFPLIFTKQFFPDVRFAFSSFYYAEPGPILFSFFTIMWLGLITYSHALLIQSYRRASPLNRNQIKYFFLATAFGYAGGSLEYLPIFGIHLYPWGHFAIPFYPVIMAYAIVKYRLMDISIVLEKSLSFLTLFIIAAIPAFGLLLWAQYVYFGHLSYPFSSILLVMFLLVVVGSYRLKHQTDLAIGRTLFRGRHEMADTLATFSKALVTILEFQTLTEEIVSTLTRVMGLRTASLFILEQEKNVFTRTAIAGPSTSFANPATSLKISDALPTYMRVNHTPLVREELEHDSQTQKRALIIATLNALEAEVCLPLINKGRLLGFCSLGPRDNPSSYSDDDIHLLTTLAQEAAIAVDNALLYEDLKRSQTLLRRTDRLRSLEIMAGGFAHEIRNPLTSIKTFVQLAPGRSSDQNFLKNFGRIVVEDVGRIERLTQEVLEFARQTTQQFKEENLNEIIESSLYILEVKDNSKSLVIEKQLSPELPPVNVDRQQIKQVFLNLFLNALEAMNPDGGKLLIKTHVLLKSGGEKKIHVEVTDTGRGIPPDDLEHVFDPFFTTKHESREREGTGLGLTIAHQIVQEHGGTIDVKSVQKSGSSFFISLPSATISARL